MLTPERPDLAAVAAHLLPVLRRVTSPVSALLVAHEQPSRALFTRPVDDWLHAAVVEDAAHTVRYVQVADRERWGASEREIWEAALHNLAEEAALEVQDHVVRVRDQGGYASSRVLLPGWRKAVRSAVLGEPVFLAPDVDELVVVGRDDPALPDWLGWAFDTFRDTARPLSPAPLFDPGQAPRNLALLAAFTYAEQDEVLLQTAPDGVYVGEFVLHLSGDGARSRTSADRDHDCWLPLADEIEVDGELIPFETTGSTRIPDLLPPRFLWPARRR